MNIEEASGPRQPGGDVLRGPPMYHVNMSTLM